MDILNIYDENPEYKDVKVFVETKTYKENFEIIKFFDKYITIENDIVLYKKNKEILDKKNVLNLYGNNIKLLDILLPSFVYPTMYFIEPYESDDNKYSIPLLEKINVILCHNKGKNIFVLNNVGIWINNDKNHSWGEISIDNILDIFLKHKVEIKKHYLVKDRYIILTKHI